MIEQTTPQYLAVGLILAALMAGVVSPGPSFVQVARIAVSRSRADGLAAALGMGVGALFFATVALAGLQVVLTAVPSLYVALKVLGGAYLAWMGWQIWRGADQPLAVDLAEQSQNKARWQQSFMQGLITQISNPKTAVVYASIFAALLPAHLTLAPMALLLLGVFLEEAGWYAAVALVLSSTAPRKAYLRFKGWVDRVAAGVMGLLGVRLIASASET
jgi:threonine/homoserine/homoserine lactone efflux protein